MTTVWTNRDNVDPSGWNNRGFVTGGSSVGGGTTSFFLGPLTNFVFWSPRFSNFGTVSSGLDQWQKRTHGTDGWSIR